MNGGKGGREGNDVAARLAVAGLTIQQATVVHPPGMAWLGDRLRVRRLGLTTNTRFLTPSPSEILLDLDLVLLVLVLALALTVAVAVVAVSRPPVSVCRNIRVAILVAPPTNAVAFRTSTSKRLVRYFASLVYHAMLPVPPRYTDTGKYRTNRNMFIQSTGVK